MKACMRTSRADKRKALDCILHFALDCDMTAHPQNTIPIIPFYFIVGSLASVHTPAEAEGPRAHRRDQPQYQALQRMDSNSLDGLEV